MFEIITTIGESLIEGATQIWSIFQSVISLFNSFWSFLPSPFDKILPTFFGLFIVLYGFKIYGIIKNGG